MFVFRNGFLVKAAPEKGEAGDAAGVPAGEEAGSEETDDFELPEEFAEADEGLSQTEEAETDAEEDEAEETDADADAESDSDADEESDESDADAEEEGTEEEEGGEEAEQMSPEQIEALRTEYMDKVSEQYSLTDEEADLMRTEPEKAMPKLLARVHTQALEQAVQVMRHNLPNMVSTLLNQQQTAKTHEQKFFKTFPELKTQAAQKVAAQMAKSYRASNPDAPMDEVIENVGLMTWRRLGLPMEKLAERLGGGQVEESFTPAAKKAEKRKGGYKPEQAGRSRGGDIPREKGPANEFEEIAAVLSNDTFFDS